ncbi:MAG TPA: hypothetical protein DCQ64_31780 [Candidatus Rokubacteria bacterium]|nr:hypothetical protein [Candidatus Rokubacteria bacterium]
MIAAPIGSLALPAADESDLRWRFGRDYEGDLGLHSNAGALLDLERLGTRIQVSLRVAHDMDQRMLRAASRLRRIDRRLARLSRTHLVALWCIYGPMRPLGDRCWRSAELGLDLGWLVRALPESGDGTRLERAEARADAAIQAYAGSWRR